VAGGGNGGSTISGGGIGNYLKIGNEACMRGSAPKGGKKRMKRARKTVAVTLALIGVVLLLSALTGANTLQFNTFCTNNPASGSCWSDIVDRDTTVGTNNTCDTTDGYNDLGYLSCSRYCNDSADIRCGCVGASHTFLAGETVTESCTLNCDITSNGTCFTIGANNITLDGGGHRLGGNSTGAGIEVPGKIGVTITGITIANFKYGIHLVNSQHCTVINSTVSNSSGTGIGRGIFLDESSHNIIADNRVQANDFQGMYLKGSSDNVIANTTANSNGYYGIVLWSGSNNNVVTNNTASDNKEGITLGYAMGNLVSNNTIRDNTQFGIELQQSSNTNTFCDNTIINNSEIGIAIGLFGTSYQGNMILMNTIGQHNQGLYLRNATNTTIAGNTVTETTTGIMLEQSAQNTISNNSVDTYSSTGISLYRNSPHNQVLNNTVCGGANYSGNLGIALDGADHTVVKGNTVSKNRGRGISVNGNSRYALVDSNDVRNNNGYWGIGIGITSPQNTINNNTISFNDIGVNVINYAHDLAIFNNTIDQNLEIGLELWAGRESNITNNRITSNGEYGIYLFEYSSDNCIDANTVCGNRVRDFYLDGSPVGNSGVENVCYLPDGWNDTGVVGCTYLCEAHPIFATGAGTYPSIPGRYRGTITPNRTIIVRHLSTYPCPGTGGHSEYVKLWNSSTGWNVTATWHGYQSDWQHLSFEEPFIFEADETYNYSITTGSYPQIIHAEAWNATGGVITCTSCEDANGNVHTDWIPAIQLWSD
jgi:parallel beta-helix repeat protein